MNNTDLMQRLYVLPNGTFESDGRFTLVKHICASTKDLGKGKTIKDFSNIPNKIRCKANRIQYLIEHKDFEITIKGIKFI